VRYGINCDSAALLALAERELVVDEPWLIDAVHLLERRATDYELLAEWRLG
jgi:hypothetical protein